MRACDKFAACVLASIAIVFLLNILSLLRLKCCARILAAALAAIVAGAAAGASAPWYQWRSKSTGKVVCAQVLHGEWERIAGPFKDARCIRKGWPG